MTSDWLLPHCSKLPCTHFLRELSTLPETDKNEERGKTELVEIQESCEQFSGRSSSPTVSVQNWSLTLWNKRANQISVNRGFVHFSCSYHNYCQNLELTKMKKEENQCNCLWFPHDFSCHCSFQNSRICQAITLPGIKKLSNLQ